MATWKQLSPAPCTNDSVIITGNHKNKIYIVNKEGKVLKYSTESDKWKEICRTKKIKKGSITMNSAIQAASMDFINNIIYILRANGSMAFLEVQDGGTSEWKIRNNLLSTQIGIGSQGLMIGNKFHAIGGYPPMAWHGDNPCMHVVYNPDTQKMDILHEFDPSISIGFHRVIKIKDTLLSFGKYIHQYQISKKAWKLLPTQMPNALSCFGCVEVLNGKYVLLLGGSNDSAWEASDDIWIYRVEDRVFTKSEIKCPDKDEYDAVSICDRNKDKCLTFGFLRDCWSRCGINDHLFPPEYLVGIMLKYYWNEYIHLIAFNHGRHWIINVLDILA